MLRTNAASIVFATCLLVDFSALAANRCTDAKGKVTYQDTACEPSANANPVDTTDARNNRPLQAPPVAPVDPVGSRGEAYASAKGSWRGPAQFQLTKAGVRDSDAHSISPIVLELRPNGEVLGIMMEAGCKISGLTQQFVAPYIASLDVSVKGCKDGRFNARYSGYLHSTAAAKEAKLTLNTLSMPSYGRVQQASIEAVLKR